jgi:pyruvate dehydrogenase E2 component (dihydrolipoamide acetyltransferase)
MTKISVPQLDANLVDVTITRWHKQVGDLVAAGEIVATLTTDKAAYELEAPAGGVLLAITAAEKSIVLAGSVIGAIGAPGETMELPAGRGGGANKSSTPLERASGGAGDGTAASLPSRGGGGRVRATPRARRLAHERGLDLATIQAETGAEIIDEAVLAPYL